MDHHENAKIVHTKRWVLLKDKSRDQIRTAINNKTPSQIKQLWVLFKGNTEINAVLSQ